MVTSLPVSQLLLLVAGIRWRAHPIKEEGRVGAPWRSARSLAPAVPRDHVSSSRRVAACTRPRNSPRLSHQDFLTYQSYTIPDHRWRFHSKARTLLTPFPSVAT
jgi:hypothetical protein